MQGRDAGDRSERIVRSDADGDRLRHRGDLLGFQKPAAMADVGLDDVDGRELEQLVELVAVDQPLAGCERDRRLGGDQR